MVGTLTWSLAEALPQTAGCFSFLHVYPVWLFHWNSFGDGTCSVSMKLAAPECLIETKAWSLRNDTVDWPRLWKFAPLNTCWHFLSMVHAKWELVSSLAAHSVHVCSSYETTRKMIVLKVTLYFSLSGIKLCALKKSVSCALPMYPCKWPNYSSLCLYLLLCDPIPSPSMLYIESPTGLYIGVMVCILLAVVHTSSASPSIHPWLSLRMCVCSNIAQHNIRLQYHPNHRWPVGCPTPAHGGSILS